MNIISLTHPAGAGNSARFHLTSLHRLVCVWLLLLAANAAQAQFDATAIAGCQLWLSADYGVVVDGNGKVSYWSDQSGNYHDLGQTTAINQPSLVNQALGGLPVVRFDGVNSYLSANISLSSATNATMFMVLKAFKPAAAMRPFDCGSTTTTNARRGLYLETTGVITCLGATPTNPVPAGGYLLVSGSNSGTNAMAYINGVLKTNQAVLLSPSASPTVVGARNNFSDKYAGDVAELLVYDGVLSDTDRQSVETYRHLYDSTLQKAGRHFRCLRHQRRVGRHGRQRASAQLSVVLQLQPPVVGNQCFVDFQ